MSKQNKYSIIVLGNNIITFSPTPPASAICPGPPSIHAEVALEQLIVCLPRLSGYKPYSFRGKITKSDVNSACRLDLFFLPFVPWNKCFSLQSSINNPQSQICLFVPPFVSKKRMPPSSIPIPQSSIPSPFF